MLQYDRREHGTYSDYISQAWGMIKGENASFPGDESANQGQHARPPSTNGKTAGDGQTASSDEEYRQQFVDLFQFD